MTQIAIISGTFHLLAVIFLAVLWWQKTWWQCEAEALQVTHLRMQDRLRSMIRDVQDTQEELDGWERQAAELRRDAEVITQIFREAAIKANRQYDMEKAR